MVQIIIRGARLWNGPYCLRINWSSLTDLWIRHNKEHLSMKQGERSVFGFFTDLKILWEELESWKPTPKCICKVKCNCSLMKNVNKYKDLEYVIYFLKGFNDFYDMVKTWILLMDPLPSINVCSPLFNNKKGN